MATITHIDGRVIGRMQLSSVLGFLLKQAIILCGGTLFPDYFRPKTSICTPSSRGNDLDAVSNLCTRTIWLENGRIVMDGPTEVVVAAYEQSRTASAAPASADV